MLILIISAMALIAYLPTLQDARFDTATRQVVDQLRQGPGICDHQSPLRAGHLSHVVVGGKNQYRGRAAAKERFDGRRRSGQSSLEHHRSSIPRAIPRLRGNSRYAGRLWQRRGRRIRRPERRPGRRNVVPKRRRTCGRHYVPANQRNSVSGFSRERTHRRARLHILGGTGRARGWKGTGTTWTRF